MAYPNPLDFARIPTTILVALDWRPFHFAIQPYHYLIRLAHIVSVAVFFGGIVILDLRLCGLRRIASLRAFADQILPTVYATFVLATLTGMALFLYDPVHVGSHAYFGPKLLLILVGMANAHLFGRTGYLASLGGHGHDQTLPIFVRLAGALSLAIWIGVMICASLNVEAAPRVLLR